MSNGGKPAESAESNGPESINTDARIRDLEAREAAVREREEAIRAREAAEADGGSGRRFNPKNKPFRGPTPYKFRVGPLAAKYHDKLPMKEVEAVDESEAKRWYAESHEDPERPGQAVDTVRIELTAKCIDPRRLEAQKHALRIANIRAKRDSGVALSKDEERMLLQAEEAALLDRAA